MSEPKNVNVNIPNVISWFEESEQCMLHNHAEVIPNSLDKVQHWKKIADDWRQAAIALATDAGDPHMAIDCYEDIRDDLYQTVRERMYVTPSTAKRVFDGIHDYANVISQKTLMAEAQRSLAEADGSSDYYYWEGYVEALDYAIDFLPNYNH
jgi:hypothetical protein